ncbi:MAG: DUF4931 domain-containing protein [Patescibacteria group bacterium]|jgi:diadenosine tetraphosphate (Ap4A) HIT family hydrolase
MRILEKKRAGYKKKYQTGDCPFCDKRTIKDQEIKALESKYWMVLACKYPYMNGNLMIVPKRCVDDTSKLNASEWADFPGVLVRTQKILKKAFGADSFNLAMNIGPNAGGTVKHLHLMIVPRADMRNITAMNLFHDFYLVSMDYKELQNKLNKIKI